MNRKGRQTVEREAKRLGASVVDWDHGQKHEIASIRTAEGAMVELALARNSTDEVMLRRLLQRTLGKVAA